MIITKDLAREFCSAFNAARPGQKIYVNSNGTVSTGAGNDPWLEMEKYWQQFSSTEAAFSFLQEKWGEAVQRLNTNPAR